jgi:glycosyltransferase involved in cell wall biosynthesis
MNTISVVIITLNEEDKIGRCISSVHDIVDEVVVVDSYSTDRTEEVCRSFDKVVFIKQKFLGYIEQKNFAKDQAKGNFILSLDADEALDADAREELKKIRYNAGADAYAWNRLNNFCGKWIRHGAWYPDRKVRLWRNGMGTWTGMNPHDKLTLKTGGKTERLKGHILHYTVADLREHIAQMNSFSSIGAAALFKKGCKGVSVRIIINPLFRFFRDYFIKMGFLDGYYGFLIAMNTSYGVFLKYSKLKMMQKRAITAQDEHFDEL